MKPGATILARSIAQVLNRHHMSTDEAPGPVVCNAGFVRSGVFVTRLDHNPRVFFAC
jgi:hypothetical protein